MSDNEFSINDDTFQKILSKKIEMGFENKSWDEWFLYLLSTKKQSQDELQEIMQKANYQKWYDIWIKNFSLNLSHIWNENSAKSLTPKITNSKDLLDTSAIVIGRGPSLKKYDHLKKLANSNYDGSIICCDSTLIPALEAGVTPEKFPNFYVVTIDAGDDMMNFYDSDIVDGYGEKIKGVFGTVTSPLVLKRAREAKIDINWLHCLFDFHEGKKSFNQISASMVRTKKHFDGLPGIQTGGNAGTSSWFIGWRILKCSKICLIGIDHSWDENDSLEKILSNHEFEINFDKNNPAFKKLFPKIYNPEFKCTCVLDPIFTYYSNALKEFISRSPQDLTTINATEGGCIFGERIHCMKFEEFLRKNKHN